MKLEPCPCCGEANVSSFETCPVCGWCNDYANKAYPDVNDLANNKMSLNEARAAWKVKKKKIA
ncbi:MAG: CPCC family cysteine-rich protein [Schwartzia succinivorans]|nr:CPCC family cysteine-rich protein [Schwartzia succinivorans]